MRAAVDFDVACLAGRTLCVGDPADFNLSADFYATTVTAGLRRSVQTTLFYQAEEAMPDDSRVADIQLVREGDRTWMFYITGRRLHGRIYARELPNI